MLASTTRSLAPTHAGVEPLLPATAAAAIRERDVKARREIPFGLDRIAHLRRYRETAQA